MPTIRDQYEVVVAYNPNTLALEKLRLDASGALLVSGGGGGGGSVTQGTSPWVVDGSAVTQPVSAVSLPLPTGASTAAKQDTGNTSLGAIDTSTAAIDGSTRKVSLTAVSGSVSSSGNNLLVTPAAGKKVRVSYLAYNPATACECAFRFGAAGGLFLRNSLTAGSIVAKDLGDLRYVEGAVDEVLMLNLSAAVPTIWNCLYVEA